MIYKFFPVKPILIQFFGADILSHLYLLKSEIVAAQGDDIRLRVGSLSLLRVRILSRA